MSLLALATVLAAGPVLAADRTFVSVDDDHIAWDDPANWSGSSVPTIGDNATIAAGLLRGAEVKDFRDVKSLILDSGLNVYRSGTLQVVDGITANTGYFVYDGTVIADVVNNTYIAGTGAFIGDLDNGASGAVITDGLSSGALGSWRGDVLSNAGFIVNGGGTWKGDIIANTGMIINQDGGTWIGDVVSNTADIYSNRGVWIGDINNAGSMELSGILRGSITNSSTVAVNDPLSEVTDIVNNGIVRMNDGAADDTLSAQSWSGNGILVVDFSPVAFASDSVALSGALSGDTEVQFVIVGSGARTLGEVPVVTVDQAGGGTLTATGLPGDGVISYRLVKDGNGWAIASLLSDAPAHVATAIGVTGSMLDRAEAIGLEKSADECGTGAWVRGLHRSAEGGTTNAGFSGGQFGYDLACLPLTEAGTLGIGVTVSFASGSVATDFTAGPSLTGDFSRSALGVYASLIEGAFRAVVEGQLANTSYRIADRGSKLDTAHLSGPQMSVSGSAGYDLALGAVTFTPEIGLAAQSSRLGSPDFADMGAVALTFGPGIQAHAGVTLSADLDLGTSLTLSPFASLALHGDLVAPNAAGLTDSAGSSVALALKTSAPYVAIAAGVDLVRRPTAGAGALNAGLRGSFSAGPGLSDISLAGHAQVTF